MEAIDLLLSLKGFLLVSLFFGAYASNGKDCSQRFLRHYREYCKLRYLLICCYFYILTFFFFLEISVDQPAVMINRGENTRKIDFVNFVEEKFSYLNITALAKSVVGDSECAFSCLDNLACFSFNLAAFPDKAGKFTCEILSSEKYNNSENFLPSKTFHHFSIVVRSYL